MIVPALFAAAKLAIHLFANRGYGYFRDELYFLVCGERLDWGYVDHPPMVAAAAAVSRALFGDSLSAIRLLPALAGAIRVLLAGLLARELGGRRFAQALACVCVIVAPVYLSIDNILSMNAFEPLFWTGCAYVFVRLVQGADPRLWLVFGALAGLGLQNKHSMLFFGFALVLSILLTPQRRLLASRWLWLGGAVALLVFLPNLLWQVRHDWATLELLRTVKESGKNVVLSPGAYFAQQILIMHPLTFPVWATGLAWLIFSRAGRAYRALGLAWMIAFVLFVALEGKNYYLAPAFPMLFAAGAVALERVLEARPWLRFVTPAYLTLLIAGGALFAPLVLPVLPPEEVGPWARRLGVKAPRTENLRPGRLPQHYADMFGWPELAEAVARVYHALPAGEQKKAAIFASNFGEAGAIDFFGARHGLPKAISGHQNYFLWGTRGATGEVVIVVGEDREDVEESFESVEEAGRFGHPLAMPYESGPIFVGRRPRVPLSEIWPRVKNWI